MRLRKEIRTRSVEKWGKMSKKKEKAGGIKKEIIKGGKLKQKNRTRSMKEWGEIISYVCMHACAGHACMRVSLSLSLFVCTDTDPGRVVDFAEFGGFLNIFHALDSVTRPVTVVVKVRDYIIHLLDRCVYNLRTCSCAWRVGAVGMNPYIYTNIKYW